MMDKVPEVWRTPLAIAALLVSAFGLLMTMNRTDETTAVQLEARLAAAEAHIIANEKQITRFEIILNGRRNFMNDAGGAISFLCSESPECTSRYGIIRIPE